VSGGDSSAAEWTQRAPRGRVHRHATMHKRHTHARAAQGECRGEAAGATTHKAVRHPRKEMLQ
jgi:hypothetical protein